ncbi:MAG: hypothetical protein J6B65_00205 [Paludibacteraceae bacterium]|nr:hypothetical protein [Paludibacteraceae bacterium]
MEYNKNYTTSFSFAKECLREINDLSKTDGGKGCFSEDMLVWAVDDIERLSHPYQLMDTVDVAIGVSDSGIREVNKRILLCEFKFRCKNVNNLTKKDLEAKISYTQTLFSPERIEPNVYFLFSDKQTQQARSLFERNLYSVGSFKGKRIVKKEQEFANMFNQQV